MRIDEPINFDAADFTVVQDEGRYGRDISFSGEDIDYQFTPRVSKYGHSFHKIVDYDNIYGYESQINYILKEGDVEYVVGQINFQNKETDHLAYFSCQMIQSTNRARLKRHSDTKVDLFSDEDVDGNYIDPVKTTSILLKAKPITQVSKWISTKYAAYTFTRDGNETFHLHYQNAITQITAQTIENTLSGGLDRAVTTFTNDPNFYTKVYDFPYIDAENDLSNVSINVEGVKFSYFIEQGGDINDNWFSGSPVIRIETFILPIGQDDYTQADVYPDGNSASDFLNLNFTPRFIATENVDRFNFPNLSGQADRYDLTIEDDNFIIKDVPRGFRLVVLFNMGRNATITEWLAGETSVNVKSTAIDSVTDGIRLVDAMEQVSKSINPVPFSAPRFEEDGEHYENFVFNGNMLRGIEAPYVMEWKDIVESLQEYNADYEIHDSVFIGHYNDFYRNVEIADFLELPDESFNLGYNPRYAINKFGMKYSDYEQDTDNTLDGVHTEMELNVPNKMVENFKDIELPFIRDPFKLESTRKESVLVSTTSLSEDDKTFVVECIPLPPNTESGFSASITHFVNSDGDLQLLNDGTFNWGLLGFDEGDTFNIDNTDNANTYTVKDITPSIITLSGGAPSAIEVQITEVRYPLTNVEYTIRTNEGFEQITGVLSPDEFANLNYTIKRNILNYWGSYLKTSSKYRPKTIRLTYLKNDSDLVTQLIGEDEIVEKANIEQEQLTDAILSPRLISTTVRCNFGQYVDFKEKLLTERGFVRIYDHFGAVLKGHPQESSFKWADNIMTMSLEERSESEFLDISFDGLYIIDGYGYPENLVSDIDYKVEDGFIQFFDANTRPLANRKRWDFITVEGEKFNTIEELLTAINGL